MHLFNQEAKGDHTTHFPLLSATQCDREGRIYRHGSKGSLDPRIILQSAPRTAPPQTPAQQLQGRRKHKNTEQSGESCR